MKKNYKNNQEIREELLRVEKERKEGAKDYSLEELDTALKNIVEK